jgi:hypothetical protein
MKNIEMTRSDGYTYSGTIAFPQTPIYGYAIVIDLTNIEIAFKNSGFIIDTKISKYGKVYFKYNCIDCIHNFKNDTVNYYLIITAGETTFHYRYNEKMNDYNRIMTEIEELVKKFLE